MIAAILGLSPTLLAILAAVCSPRLGLCALHGQLLYFAGLLLYSPLPLTVITLWLVPLWACALFFCGVLFGVFLVRDDVNPRGERARLILTAGLILLNFLLLILLLHSVFKIMCFRLDEALDLPAVRGFTLILKAGGGVLLVWLAAGLFSGRRRAGLAALYAWFGLLFGTYLVLFHGAGKITWDMPLKLQRALQLRSDMEYFTIAASAGFAPALYFIPPLAALLCGLLGYGLLRPVKKRPARGKLSTGGGRARN